MRTVIARFTAAEIINALWMRDTSRTVEGFPWNLESLALEGDSMEGFRIVKVEFDDENRVVFAEPHHAHPLPFLTYSCLADLAVREYNLPATVILDKLRGEPVKIVYNDAHTLRMFLLSPALRGYKNIVVDDGVTACRWVQNSNSIVIRLGMAE